MSINIKPHKLNIPSNIIDRCWGLYSQKYKNIEDNINSTHYQVSDFLQTHTHSTGAFQISVDEFETLEDSTLKKYFLSPVAKRLVIKTSSKYVFRGADYYIGLQKLSTNKKSELIFSRLVSMVKLLDNISTEENIILHLALLDYIRNYLFILMYSIHQAGREYGYMREVKAYYSRYVELVEKIEFEYVYCLSSLESNSQKGYLNYVSSLRALEDYLNKTIEKMSKHDKLKEDIFRKMRESDNPIRIYNFSKNLAKMYMPQNSLLIGIEYGGIELPYIVNAYRKLLGKSEIKIMTVNLSSYSTGTDKYVDKLEDAISPFFSKESLVNFGSAYVLDDAVTTGRTLEYLVKLLPENIQLVYFYCVSFTNTNRYHHLARFEHGGVNPIIFSPGTALYPSNYTQTFSKSSYTNKKGVFNKEKEQIIQMQKTYFPNLIN